MSLLNIFNHRIKKLKIQKDIDELIKILKKLGSKRWRARYEIIKALKEIGNREVSEIFIFHALNDKNSHVRDISVDSLVDLGEPVIVIFIKALADNKSIVRKNAAEALGRIGDKKALKPLLKSLKDEDYRVISTSIISLCKIGDEKSIKPIINAFTNINKHVEENEDKKYVKKLSNTVFEHLIELLNSKNSSIRIEVAFSLANTNINEYLEENEDKKYVKKFTNTLVEQLIKLLKNKNPSIRIEAAFSLAKIKTERSIDAIIEAWKKVCRKARYFEKEVNKDVENEFNDFTMLVRSIGNRCVKPLLFSLNDKDKFVRKYATLQLEQLAEKSELEPLRDSYESESDLPNKMLMLRVLINRGILDQREM